MISSFEFEVINVYGRIRMMIRLIENLFSSIGCCMGFFFVRGGFE